MIFLASWSISHAHEIIEVEGIFELHDYDGDLEELEGEELEREVVEEE